MLKHDNTVTESVDSVPVTDKEQDDNAFYLSVIKDIILWIEHNRISHCSWMWWLNVPAIPNGIFSGF